MENFYTVVEVQNAGTPAAIPVIYTNMNTAYNKYYNVLAAASVSSIPYHACYIIRDDGVMIEGKVYDRREPDE